MMWAGVPMEPCTSSKCLTMPTLFWAMQCHHLRGRIPSKTVKGLTSVQISLWKQAVLLFKHVFSCPCSTLGRIIRLTQEVIEYREWIIKKWGGRDSARTDNRGTNYLILIYGLIFDVKIRSIVCVAIGPTCPYHLSPGLPPKEPVSEQEPCVLGGGVGSEEQQRDSVSPHSADSPMSISSPQQHSSASSVSSLSGSDNVRRQHQNSSAKYLM